MQARKLLIIDDDDVDTYVSKRIIEEQSFAGTVVTASSVKEAMEYLKKTPAAESPDYIFLDLNMPGQSGLDFLKEFEAQQKGKSHTPIIVLLMNIVSGEHPEMDLAKAHPLVNHVIEKPLTAAKLKQLS